jgi:hypothetical protein
MSAVMLSLLPYMKLEIASAKWQAHSEEVDVTTTNKNDRNLRTPSILIHFLEQTHRNSNRCAQHVGKRENKTKLWKKQTDDKGD